MALCSLKVWENLSTECNGSFSPGSFKAYLVALCFWLYHSKLALYLLCPCLVPALLAFSLLWCFLLPLLTVLTLKLVSSCKGSVSAGEHIITRPWNSFLSGNLSYARAEVIGKEKSCLPQALEKALFSQLKLLSIILRLLWCLWFSYFAFYGHWKPDHTYRTNGWFQEAKSCSGW